MAKTDDPGGNGVKWFGVSVQVWVDIVQKLGATMIVALVACALAWKIIPPIADSYINFVTTTGESMKASTVWMEKTANAMIELAESSKDMHEFSTKVEQYHAHMDSSVRMLLDNDVEAQAAHKRQEEAIGRVREVVEQRGS